jgi:hypothetical protein
VVVLASISELSQAKLSVVAAYLSKLVNFMYECSTIVYCHMYELLCMNFMYECSIIGNFMYECSITCELYVCMNFMYECSIIGNC